MKNSTKYVLIAICIIMILLAAVGVVWAFANKFSEKAYADYEDLGTNTVVNFNQLFNNTIQRGNYNTITFSKTNATYNINGYFNNYNANLCFNATATNIELYANHIYYLDYKLVVNSGPTPSLHIVNGSNVYYGSGNNKQLVNMTNNDTVYLGFQVIVSENSSTNPYNFSVTPMLIDLTQMFGAGNEPNLQQAQEYFTADYYNYTTGTPIPYSKDYLQGYQQGIIDFQNSLKTTFNNDVIGTMSFAANVGGIQSTIDYNANYGAYVVEGVAGIHFGNTITSQVEFYIEFFLPNYSGGLYFVVFDYSNGTLVPISTDEIVEGTATSNPYVRSVFNISNMDTLYFGVFDSTQQFSNSTVVTGYFFKSELTIYTIDVAALITQSIGQTQANYVEGGAGYESIYNQGYLAGVSQGNATLETMDYIGAAFTGIGSILQIELLPGIPFSLFILLPLMFGLIGFVVKLSKGGS